MMIFGNKKLTSRLFCCPHQSGTDPTWQQHAQLPCGNHSLGMWHRTPSVFLPERHSFEVSVGVALWTPTTLVGLLPWSVTLKLLSTVCLAWKCFLLLKPESAKWQEPLNFQLRGKRLKNPRILDLEPSACEIGTWQQN